MWPTAQNRVTRRAFLAATGSAACCASAGAAVGTAAAQAPHRLRLPALDSLTVQVIVDNAVFGPFLGNEDRPGLKVLREAGGARAPNMPLRPLAAEFGLSLLLSSAIGTDRRQAIFDLGYSKEALANNLSLLDVDVARIEAAALSHGHIDHYGGFRGLFGGRPPPRGPIPLHVGGEESFCQRVAAIGEPPVLMGALDRAQLLEAGLAAQIRSGPAMFAGHGATTGTIALESFERAAVPTRMRPGIGCSAALIAPAKRAQSEIGDDGEHELAAFYAIKGLGLVVIAACSHRGLINSIRQAQRISGIERVHAVVGGFHLVSPRTAADAVRTVDELVKIGPAYLIPMHCSGETFIAEANRRMPGRLVRPYVGNRFIFAR